MQLSVEGAILDLAILSIISGKTIATAEIGEMDNGKNLSITEIRKRKFAYQIGMDVSIDENGAVADCYFQKYSANQSYEDVFENAFNGKYIIDLIKAVWGAEPPYKLLDCGSANGADP